MNHIAEKLKKQGFEWCRVEFSDGRLEIVVKKRFVNKNLVIGDKEEVPINDSMSELERWERVSKRIFQLEKESLQKYER